MYYKIKTKGVYNMKGKLKRLRPLLFTLVGALAGLAYYYFIGCANGTCAITSRPLNSMLYMALLGWLVSQLFEGGSANGCDM